MSKMELKGVYAYKTDVGKIRISNEDQASASFSPYKEALLVVCDGMGGANKGDYASKTAIDSLMDDFRSKRKMLPFLAKRWLSRALRKANSIIYSESESNPSYAGMGTTTVAVMLLGDKMVVANVGDSRAYAYDGFNLRRLTEDQTVGDYLVRVNKMSEKEVASSPERHVLTNALGVYPSCASDIRIYPYFGETILLCSDGLYNNLSEASIRATLSTDERPDEKVASLIAEANSNGGSDNIGIVLWEASKRD